MYHKVSGNNNKDFLTVSLQQLEEQFIYLQQQGYNPILLSDLVAFVQHNKPLPAHPLLITFDDGYRDNYEVMYPLLLKYGMKAVIFLVPSFLGQQEHLCVADILAMNPQQVEFGLHSVDHKSYKTLSPEKLAEDIAETKALLRNQGISFQPGLAFPYGAYPKQNLRKRKKFFDVLRQQELVVAFRIGNRFNSLPLHNPLLVQRLDIRGDDPPEKFRKRLKISV
jgi:peptidoglycan/xylan/chitin deacetylase (PgdA/CDA1 family)